MTVADPRLERYADILVHHSLRVQPGEKVLLQFGYPARPLVEALYRQVVAVGAFPLVQLAAESLQHLWLTTASTAQLSTLTDVEEYVIKHVDCYVSIRAPENARALSQVPPERLALLQRSRQPLQAHLMAGKTRWVACNFPTHALAQEAECSLSEYEDFVYNACLIDWDQTRTAMEKVKAAFDAADTVRLVGPGTDLTLSLAGRQGTVCAGERNLPDGEVFYAPVETATTGTITYDYPAIYMGREVAGVRLEFAGGRVVQATADKGEAFLQAVLDTDPGARVLGELGIGCNFSVDRFSRDILFDEKIGGTVHLALGRAYEQSGGQNNSAVHWDMIRDMRRGGEIYVDGRLVQQNGQFIGL